MIPGTSSQTEAVCFRRFSMTTKRLLSLCLFLLVVILLPVYSEQDIQKIGLVDSSRIMSTYFQDSKSMRELKELKERILATSDGIKEEIFELKRRKVEAERREDGAEVLRLEDLIAEKERFLKEYIQIKNREYREKQREALQDSFLIEVTEAIEHVAISEGFSIILEKQNQIFLYYSVDVDITDKVLDYLLEKSGQQ
jgi:Skp family chaperone for outer membrane proteins